jgi:cyclase
MNRTVLVRLSAALLTLCGAWIAYTQDKGKGKQQGPPELTMVRMRDDLYVIQGDASGNVGTYITNEGVILIDDKFERDYTYILEKVKSVTNQPIKYVLNTHQHGDHSGGNEKFLATAEIIAHKNAHDNMVRLKQPGVPRISYTDESDVFLGGKEVRARHYGRGHTNGDAVMYFPAYRLIHTGDLFVNGPFFIPDYSNGGSLKEWAHTLDQVLKLDFDDVIPGHGPMAKRSDLVKFRNRLEEMWSSASGMVKQNKSNEEISKMLLNDYKEFGGSVAAANTVTSIVAEAKQ